MIIVNQKNEKDASGKSHPTIISSEDKEISKKPPPNKKIIDYKKIEGETT